MHIVILFLFTLLKLTLKIRLSKTKEKICLCEDYVTFAGSSSEISEEIKSKEEICVPLTSLQFLEVTHKKIRKQHTDTIERLPNENKFTTFDSLYIYHHFLTATQCGKTI